MLAFYTVVGSSAIRPDAAVPQDPTGEAPANSQSVRPMLTPALTACAKQTRSESNSSPVRMGGPSTSGCTGRTIGGNLQLENNNLPCICIFGA
jgi:hypothetical protein